MTIRPFHPDDGPAVAALLADHGLCLDGLDYTRWTPVTLVAVQGTTLLGLVQATAGLPYAIITELCVRRESQRKSVGARLLQHMETILRLAGCPAWVSYAGEQNEMIRSLAERWGAHETGKGVAFVRRFEK